MVLVLTEKEATSRHIGNVMAYVSTVIVRADDGTCRIIKDRHGHSPKKFKMDIDNNANITIGDIK